MLSEKVACQTCGAMIFPRTFEKNGGKCAPCVKREESSQAQPPDPAVEAERERKRQLSQYVLKRIAETSPESEDALLAELDSILEVQDIERWPAADFHLVAAEMKLWRTVKFLVSHGAHPTAFGSGGSGGSALHRAAAHVQTDLCCFLLRNRANPNMPAIDGSTPLVVAAMKGNLELIELLVAAGADVHHVLPTLGASLPQLARGAGKPDAANLLERLQAVQPVPPTQNGLAHSALQQNIGMYRISRKRQHSSAGF